jgi:hypothetical protein
VSFVACEASTARLLRSSLGAVGAYCRRGSPSAADRALLASRRQGSDVGGRVRQRVGTSWATDCASDGHAAPVRHGSVARVLCPAPAIRPRPWRSTVKAILRDRRAKTAYAGYALYATCRALRRLSCFSYFGASGLHVNAADGQRLPARTRRRIIRPPRGKASKLRNLPVCETM